MSYLDAVDAVELRVFTISNNNRSQAVLPVPHTNYIIMYNVRIQCAYVCSYARAIGNMRVFVHAWLRTFNIATLRHGVLPAATFFSG